MKNSEEGFASKNFKIKTKAIIPHRQLIFDLAGQKNGFPLLIRRIEIRKPKENLLRLLSLLLSTSEKC